MDRLWNRTDRTSQCWIWTGPIRKDGYAHIYLDGKMMLVHRLAWILTNGSIPDGLFVCHKCDNRACINPAHLFLGTHLDNMRDMAEKGRAVPSYCNGERNGQSKLTIEQVVEIRRLRKETSLTLRSIAKKFGVGPMQIHRIANDQNWKCYSQPNPDVTLTEAEAAGESIRK